MEKNNNDDLPKGFEYIEAPPKIIVHFDSKYNRLYIPKYLLKENILKEGTSIGIAYNNNTNELLIDTQGHGFRISVSGYIITKHLYEFFLRKCKQLDKEMLHYELNYSIGYTNRFLIFKLIDTN